MTNKIKKTLMVSGISATMLFGSLAPVFASTPPTSFVPVSQSGNSTQLGTTEGLNTFLSTVVDLIIGIAGFLVLVYLVLAGIKYVTSGGDSGKTEEARKQIIAALIGLVIVLLAYFIINLVLNVLGISKGVSSVTIPCVTTGANGGTAGLPGYISSKDGTCTLMPTPTPT